MMHPESPRVEPEILLRPLRRFLARLQRKVEALQGDLAEAQRAPELRRHAEALLTYLAQVPRRAERVTLPDPHDDGQTLEIALEPRVSPQANAARLFKRAAKGERGEALIQSQLERTRVDVQELGWVIERAESATEPDAILRGDIDRWLGRLPWSLRPRRRADAPRGPRPQGVAGAPAKAARAPTPGKLVPRRLLTREGWQVLVGRSNQGNDYLTHSLARPEDYWFHVHGAAGSHVVLRRGKGKNEPSKATLEEVAAWTAHFSQARTAGKVPVIYTRKKFVRRPRKAPPGLAVCTHEKTLIVRPREPAKDAYTEASDGE